MMKDTEPREPAPSGPAPDPEFPRTDKPEDEIDDLPGRGGSFEKL